jgi:fatty acid desaturase
MTTIADMMTDAIARRRDYSLTGPEAARAEEAGLVNARWFAPSLNRKELKALMQRRDGPALRDTAIWFASLAVFGGLGAFFWGSAWCVPFFLV